MTKRTEVIGDKNRMLAFSMCKQNWCFVAYCFALSLTWFAEWLPYRRKEQDWATVNQNKPNFKTSIEYGLWRRRTSFSPFLDLGCCLFPLLFIFIFLIFLILLSQGPTNKRQGHSFIYVSLPCLFLELDGLTMTDGHLLQQCVTLFVKHNMGNENEIWERRVSMRSAVSF